MSPEKSSVDLRTLNITAAAFTVSSDHNDRPGGQYGRLEFLTGVPFTATLADLL
jgi:hypothetical protein